MLKIIKKKSLAERMTAHDDVTGHRWIPLTEASEAERWYFLWSAPEQTAE